jgi:hypothetical protein
VGDEEWFEDDSPVEALVGSPPSEVSSSVVAEALLDLCGEMTKLHMLLEDTDEGEFRSIRARLDLLRRLVADLPAAPARGRRKIGFAVAPKRRSKRKP